MRRPHVYERSAPRGQRSAYHEPEADPTETARAIAAELHALIAKAEATGLQMLSRLLASAVDEAERISGRPDGPRPARRS